MMFSILQRPSSQVSLQEIQDREPELRREQGRCDALILDARLRQSLVTVRSLGSRGLQMAAMDTLKHVPTFGSRWCHHAFVCPRRDEDLEINLASLEQVLEQTNARVLITSSDANLELVHQHRQKLENRVCIALAKDPALSTVLDKEQTLEVARQLGLNIPRAVTIKSEGEVAAAVREIGLPAVIKPVRSWVKGKQRGARLIALLVITLEEARQVVAELTQYGVAVLFQQFLAGRREAVHMLYARDQFYARFAQWAKRTCPPLGGASVLRQSIAIPADSGEQAETLVRAINLEGYSEVEFRRDSAGVPYLMEINARLSASIELAVCSGVDFPYLLYQWANGDCITKVPAYRTGIWMRYLRGDFATTLETFNQRGRPGVVPPWQALLEFASSFAVPMKYDYIDWRDPAPALLAAVQFLRDAAFFVKRKI
jgi:predicted ATP-grasp superfamily ATP-dependent carboligase